MDWSAFLYNPILTLLRILGGLGIFLYGMQTMSGGIHQWAGNRLHGFVQGLTATPLSGILTGMGVTTLIQSSSATTVVLVSMVNAGLIPLRNSIAVIMGANIGTTFTAWAVSLLGFSLDISSFALPAIALSLPFRFSKREANKRFAQILLGFGLLFLGINEMKLGLSVLDQSDVISRVLLHFPETGLLSRLIFILLGAGLSLALQSSSAAITLTLTMVYLGQLPFSLAAAIVLGENIGTTLTAYVASLEMSVEAKRCARSHMLFNIFGVLWMFFLVDPMILLVDLCVPGALLEPSAITFHLAAFHTFFNSINTLLLAGFIPRIEKLVSWLVPEKETDLQKPGNIPWIRGNLPDAGDANLINARGAVIRLSREVRIMADYVINYFEPSLTDKTELASLIEEKEISIDGMEESILAHLSECALQHLTEEQAQWVAARMRIIGEFERIGDGLVTIHNLAEKLVKRKDGISSEKINQLLEIAFSVRDFLEYISTLLDQDVADQEMKLARTMEEEINQFRSKLDKTSRKRIKSGGNLKGELLFMEIVRRFEILGDDCIVIAKDLSR
ncbi:Na/Pi symporter [Marispirochaeta sp.]|jgi:phosphate:Na+ symporter|uniref:Na/Pi cotransporter family protein n=1 Tax=Marispirochaeta sp. TaxID=2038653 RepID=UPI0029C988ED|nr:Na/Pi symporter [Marispirochaeta sp.]